MTIVDTSLAGSRRARRRAGARRPYLELRRVGLGAMLLAASLGGAAVDDPLTMRLLPVPDLRRPKPLSAETEASLKAAKAVARPCGAKPLATMPRGLPFGPGELLHYDVSVLGVRTGRVTIRMGERTVTDGVDTYPIHAYARTEGVLSMLGTLDGRMVSYIDPAAQKPVRMVNRFEVGHVFGGTRIAREDAAFSSDGQVAGRLQYTTPDKEATWPAAAVGSSDVVDVLSVIYYARSRDMKEGTPFCFEVYHRRRLYRVEGTIGGLELISPPIGKRMGRRIDAKMTRRGRTEGDPRPVTAWVTDDRHRLPLLVQTPDVVGHLTVSLDTWTPGRRLTPVTKASN